MHSCIHFVFYGGTEIMCDSLLKYHAVGSERVVRLVKALRFAQNVYVMAVAVSTL